MLTANSFNKAIEHETIWKILKPNNKPHSNNNPHFRVMRNEHAISINKQLHR